MTTPPHETAIERSETFVVDAGQAPERIDRWITMRVQRATRTKVQDGIDAGAVLVNGKPTKSNYRVRPGDIIVVTTMRQPPIELIAQDIPLDIVYEDDDLIIVNKPAGMVTHPGYGNRDGTLVNAVLFHIGGDLPVSVEASRLEAEDEGLEIGELVDDVDVDAGDDIEAGGDIDEVDDDDAGDEASADDASNRSDAGDTADEIDTRGVGDENDTVDAGDAGEDVEDGGGIDAGDAIEAGSEIDAGSASDAGGEIDAGISDEYDDRLDIAEVRPGIVHRLDKETSGLMVVAKNADAQVYLAKQFADRTATREYWAVVWGTVAADEGEIEASIARDRKDRRKFAVSDREGRWALTRYRVIERFEFATLLALRLATGRTHQIRVHCMHIGHPVFGDPTYGGRGVVRPSSGGRHKQHVANLLKLIDRQALHAKALGVWHPTTKELVEFTSELPADMLQLVTALRVGVMN